MGLGSLDSFQLLSELKLSLPLCQLWKGCKLLLMLLLLLLRCHRCHELLVLVLLHSQLLYLHLKLLAFVLLLWLFVTLLHELELLQDLLLDLLWILFDSLILSELKTLPHLVLLLTFQDESAYVYLVSRFEELLRCELEALLLSSDPVQLVARALYQLVWILTVDEALGIDCEAKLDHFVQLRLLLLQFVDVETK